jgi:hypothetical protein
MRVHIYEEDLGAATETSIVRTTATTGLHFVGLRVWLEGSDQLHNTPEDDDRSAVTFWAEDNESGWILLEDLCHQMMLAVLAAKEE